MKLDKLVVVVGFVSGECPNFSSFVCEHEKSAKVRPFRDSDLEDQYFFFFLTNKKLFAGTVYIKILIFLKLHVYMEKKKKKIRNRFFSACHQIRILLDFS